MRPVIRGAAALAAAACVPVALASGLLAGPADAAAPRPAAPRVVSVAAIGHSSFTVLLAPDARATSHRIYVSASKHALRRSAVRRARHSSAQRSQRVTIRRLRYRAGAYYYRVEARSGARSRFGPVHHVYLRPRRPAELRAVSGAGGAYLTWRAAQATAWLVTQATDARLRHHRRTYRVRALVSTFAPYGISKGQRYWFAVRAVNGPTRSALTRSITLRPRTHLAALRLATYNVLEDRFDGTVVGDEHVAPWAQRRLGVARSIRESGADVVAIQEAADWVGEPAGYGGTRQADDLRSALGAGWVLASTERPPTEHGYFRTGDYLLYRSAGWQAIAAGGHWAVGDSRWAAYQLLRSRATGARIVVISTHLAVGMGRAFDARRERETQRLLALATAYARSANAVTVYAGDFNSAVNRNHVFDGPALAMRASGAEDSRDVAQRALNAAYNSANQYRRTPPAAGTSIDHIFVPAGVAAVSWKEVIDLSHGQFVGVIPSDHNLVSARLAIPY